MNRKVILITGSTDGIGRQTALELAKAQHEIIVHGRSPERGKKVVSDLQQLSGNENIHYLNADLTKFEDIKNLSNQVKKKFKHLDVLINNAGVFEKEEIILPNGLEQTFMVNHMAYFALTHQLLDLLRNSDEARIVNVSSMAQAGTIDFDNLNAEKFFDAYNAYAVSKLANVLFTYKLAMMLQGTNITTNCLHPGVIRTKLLHAGWGSGGASSEVGAKTSVFVATDYTLVGRSGLYFVNSQERKSNAISYDKKIQDRLWNISLEITGLRNKVF
jgi:NAD(P)-dependent dehydrogenase (short-subunit alcohol dehydrogenase family)